MLAPTRAANDANTEYSQLDYYAPRSTRSLHVIDLDNLLGSRWLGPGWALGWPRAAAVRAVLETYARAARLRWGDHQVVLATPLLAVEAKLASPSARVVVRRGTVVDSMPHDLSPELCAARYGRVVLGSGDGSMFGFLHELVRQEVA
jgi:hypothetical protein